MFMQIAIGTVLLVTVIIAGVIFWWLEVALVRAQPWRLLSGMAAINGVLNTGLITALRQVRRHRVVAETGEV